MSDLLIHFVSSSGVVAEIPLLAYGAVLVVLLIIVLSAGLIFYFKRGGKQTARKSAPNKAAKRTPQPIQSNQPLMKTFQQLNGSLRTVLLAANSIEELPVTVPIQLAIELSQKGKCLLIDFDSKRDSVAKVFEVNSSTLDRTLKPRPVSTVVDNLDLWPARFFDQLRFINLRLLLDAASKKYDYILIYAPYLPVLPDRKQIAFCAKQAIEFSKAKETPSALYDLLKDHRCKIVSQL